MEHPVSDVILPNPRGVTKVTIRSKYMVVVLYNISTVLAVKPPKVVGGG